MKALVFGAGGQLGRALRNIVPAGIDLVGLDRARCDLTDQAAVEQAVATAVPDVVVNAAAYTAVDRAESEQDAARLLNAVAPGWIAKAARKAGARTIHVSTDFVFDGSSLARPLLPTDPTSPQSVYGRTKLEGEQAVALADPDALIVRTAWVYAASGANFLLTMLRLMRERRELGVVADQIGTPTYAPSLAAAIWRMIEVGATGRHHFTDAGVASWYDFAVAIAEEARTLGLLTDPAQVNPIRTEDYPTPARRPAYSVLDKSSAWALIGYTSPHWRANLRDCLMELSNNG